MLSLLPCHAEPSPGADLTAARAAYAAQKKTLDDQYRTKLEALAKAQVQNGDLAAAAAIREEIKALAAAPAAAATAPALKGDGNPLCSGTKWCEPGGSTVEFRADGLWSEFWRTRETFGRWKTDGDKTAILVTKPDGKTMQYQISADGTACTRVSDKIAYKKVTNYFKEEAIAGTPAAPSSSGAGAAPSSGSGSSSKGGGSNPFGNVR
ncbi:hypothetical protein KBB96_08315 [Luteolibacter ambystomatis]|uniref:Uncharacterized protein n=1 Tax=Luteolibacter ambystomatis TaxID=2824561 RepID=A0A975PGM7_9BACT|nr:hypothetical protein [Luteolibacter ambystomatis]QUE52883.1 hypothetical protein KBB96_08315 [Luteolibacter ambystomatis]